jgi:hypothetical protein
MQNRPSGFGNPWLQLGLSVVCVFASELLLKRGASEVAAPDDAFSWTGINGLASPLVWWAIVLIIASFISWLYVLRYIPLSLLIPLARGRYSCSAGLLDFSRRTDFYIALVRDCAGGFRPGFGGKADRKNGGTPVSFLAFLFILFRWSPLWQRSSSSRKRWNSRRRTVCATPISCRASPSALF